MGIFAFGIEHPRDVTVLRAIKVRLPRTTGSQFASFDGDCEQVPSLSSKAIELQPVSTAGGESNAGGDVLPTTCELALSDNRGPRGFHRLPPARAALLD